MDVYVYGLNIIKAKQLNDQNYMFKLIDVLPRFRDAYAQTVRNNFPCRNKTSSDFFFVFKNPFKNL